MNNKANHSKSHLSVNTIYVRPKPNSKTKCLLRIGQLTFEASWGRTGRSIFKREGDGATPIATMPVLYGLYKHRLTYRAKSKIPMRPIQANMGWCDQSEHPNYNRPIKRPFDQSHETLLRDDSLYDFIIVLDWNISRRKRNCGSAIFFHVAKPNFPPTQGCIAVSRQTMQRILPYLSKQTRLKIL